MSNRPLARKNRREVRTSRHAISVKAGSKRPFSRRFDQVVDLVNSADSAGNRLGGD